MIIQNGQNRNLAICNARQVAMLRGGQWKIEAGVLSSAVKSQIYEDIVTTGHHSASLALEVWRAANQYCKSHAASHPELTAQGKLLSAFVNADKDMYCSLPLALTPAAQSALPTRWLVNNYDDYIDTDITFNTLQDTMYARYENDAIGTSYSLLIGSYRSIDIECYNWRAGYDTNTYATTNTYAPINTILESFISPSLRYLKSDGETKATSTIVYSTNQNYSNIRLFKSYPSGTLWFKGKFDVMEIRGLHNHTIIPYKNNGVMQIFDLETLKNYPPAVGILTELKDIPNS